MDRDKLARSIDNALAFIQGAGFALLFAALGFIAGFLSSPLCIK